MTHDIDIQYDMHIRCHLQVYRRIFLARRTSRLARLELLDLALPIVLWVKAEHLPRLLDTDETLARVASVGLVRDIGEDALDELGGGCGERSVGVGDVEDVGALEGLLEREAEALRTVSRVDIAEAATRVSMKLHGWQHSGVIDSLPSPLPGVVLPLGEVDVVLWSDDVAQTDVDDFELWVPAGELLAHLLAEELGE